MSIKHLSFLLLLLLLASPTSSFQPEGSGFVQGLLFNTQAHQTVLVGDTVELNFVIKNLTNDTAGNFTITQEIPSGVNVLSIAGLDYDGSENMTDISIQDIFSTTLLPVTYLNFTETNFTMNIDTQLDLDKVFGLNFVVNFTTTGEFVFQAPSVIYYDHWPDLNDGLSGDNVNINVISLIDDTKSQFVPRADGISFNPQLFIGGLLLVTFVALIGRMLYFKKPFDY